MSLERYEVVIGLEVHCQLDTQTKLFTGCPFEFGTEANSQTDSFSWALPGTLPVPNRRAVELALRLAVAIGAEVNPCSRWDRKHYFYPDSPLGYQITQQFEPYCRGGEIVIPGAGSRPETTVRLHHIHMEADAGKNIHVQGEDVSLVDFNRAGAPLVEIVSEPDLRSASQAADYMRVLRTLVRHLGISTANMEQGTLRCDANVSLRPRGSDTLGTRCEIKNLNSFKFVELAINAEIRRQADILDGGGVIEQSTMAYDTQKDRTWVMRGKEDAADYLYFPEPDMPPLLIDDAWVEQVRAAMPELPAARRARYEGLGLSAYDAGVLTDDAGLSRFFDACLASGRPAKKLCNWATGELLGRLNKDGRGIDESPISPEYLAELVGLIEDGKIAGPIAKKVFAACYEGGVAPAEIVRREGYEQVSDTGAIEAIVAEVIAGAASQVESYRGGNHKIRGWFVGQVMKKTKGQASPRVVNEILDRLL